MPNNQMEEKKMTKQKDYSWVMVNGLPGKMASEVARRVLDDQRLLLISCSFTGEEISNKLWNTHVRLIKPGKNRSDLLATVTKNIEKFVAVDFTQPSAVNENAEFYCENKIPFVMGTTGGNREKLLKTVESSTIPAVIAPNMAPQIVAFQAMMEFTAKNFQRIFDNYDLNIIESHQNWKKDTSGTAKTMVKHFHSMGVTPFSSADIRKVRNPQLQRTFMNIPDKYLDGHGYHGYHLMSEDGTVDFHFHHNVRGRNIYALGTIKAIKFLAKKIEEGATGVFSMIDVLKTE